MNMELMAKSRRVIRMTDARLKTGLCTSTLYDLMSRGLFPKPFPLVPGGRAVGWIEDEIDHWILQRKAASEQEAK